MQERCAVYIHDLIKDDIENFQKHLLTFPANPNELSYLLECSIFFMCKKCFLYLKDIAFDAIDAKSLQLCMENQDLLSYPCDEVDFKKMKIFIREITKSPFCCFVTKKFHAFRLLFYYKEIANIFAFSGYSYKIDPEWKSKFITDSKHIDQCLQYLIRRGCEINENKVWEFEKDFEDVEQNFETQLKDTLEYIEDHDDEEGWEDVEDVVILKDDDFEMPDDYDEERRISNILSFPIFIQQRFYTFFM